MRGPRGLLALFSFLALQTGVWATDGRRPESRSCPDDLEAAVAEHCPCDGQVNHGQYVSCVVRYGNALRKAGCRAGTTVRMIRCAALSSCGRPGAVVCCTSSIGSCDDRAPGDGTAQGVCSNKPWLACDTDADCARTRSRITRDEATCVAAGGVSGGPGSMCGACTASSTTTTSTSTSTSTSTTTSTTVVLAPVTTSTTTTTTTSTTTTLPAGVTYGNAVEFSGASQHTPDYLLGVPITVPQAFTLTHLGVIAKSGGPHVILALYSDTAGEPDRLVAFTAATSMAAGAMEMPVTSTPLAPGVYWIMGVYDADASIGIDESDAAAPVRYLSQSFSDPLPDPLPPAFSYAGQAFNYYIRVAE